jgi:MoxR-like ATPase
METVNIAGMKVPKSNKKYNDIIHTSNLVETETTKSNLKNILYPLLEGFPVLLIGDAGVGKNALIYYINSLRNYPTIRFSFNEDTLPEDLIGSYRLLMSGNAFEWVNGPLVNALQEGIPFVADEMNLASTSVIKRFSTLYESSYLDLMEGGGEKIPRTDGFSFIATQNPSEGFEGRKSLPFEITKNFAVVYVDPYPPDELYFILKNLFPDLTESLIKNCIRITLETEKRILMGNLGKGDLEKYHFNLRTLKKLCFRLSEFNVNDKAILLREVLSLYSECFRNPEDRKFQEDLIHSELNSKSVQLITDIKLYVNDEDLYCNDKQIKVKNPEKIKNLILSRPLTPEILGFLEKIITSIQLKENILIEYSDEDDSLYLQEFVTCITGNEVEFVNLCKGIHTSDILGSLKPINNKIEWLDGPLTRGIKNDSIICITSLESAGAELVEKLNMLTDDARSILLPPESGSTKPLVLGNNSVIFAYKQFRKSKSTTTISRAFRNRFTSILYPTFTEESSLRQIVEYYLPTSNLTNLLTQFHTRIRGLSHRRVIGSANLNPYIFGTSNLVFWAQFIAKNIQSEDFNSIIIGCKISYINQIYDPKERMDILKFLENGLKSFKLEDDFFEKLEDKKKTLTLSSNLEKKIWWDPELHKRDPLTGKAKIQASGNPLKKGIEINTPETGGNTKEGADAWYGSETRGNMGQGEPAGGGGAWGYRTEELYKQFLAKRKILWSYSMTVTRKEYMEIFGKELESIEMNLEKLFDPEIDITRVYQHQGRRIDARKYISFKNGRGDTKVFDKTIIDKKTEKLKGVEVVFLVSKSRRIFNFEYSVVVLSALITSSIILNDHDVDFSIYTYSDRLNKKDHIDLINLKNFEDEYSTNKEEEIFDSLTNDWQGDSVHEYLLLENLEKYFSPDSSTRIVVMISDFRGQRGKSTVEQELSSFENRKLKEYVLKSINKSYILLGVGLGNRFIAEEIFHDSIQITGDNFTNMPNLLGSELSKLILTNHSV